jgi:hypothetical protein
VFFYAAEEKKRVLAETGVAKPLHKETIGGLRPPKPTLKNPPTPPSADSVGGGGERGIRTLGTVARTTVFETVPFDRSGISPKNGLRKYDLIPTFKPDATAHSGSSPIINRLIKAASIVCACSASYF